jgi:hypothetical protein
VGDALDDRDRRRFTVPIAGAAALVVAKAYKLRDRIAEMAGNALRAAVPPCRRAA